MNIIVVNVNTSRSMTEAIAAAARRYASCAHPASPAGGQGGE